MSKSKKQLDGVNMRMGAIIEFLDEHTSDDVSAKEFLIENIHPDLRFPGEEQHIQDMKVRLDLLEKHEPEIVYSLYKKHYEQE